MTVLSNALVISGIFFFVAATVGLLRLPDVFSRSHAVAKAETLGLALVLIGMAVRPGTTGDVVVRLVVLGAIALIGNPTAAHAITRAARRAGEQPWTLDDGYDDGKEGSS